MEDIILEGFGEIVKYEITVVVVGIALSYVDFSELSERLKYPQLEFIFLFGSVDILKQNFVSFEKVIQVRDSKYTTNYIELCSNHII